MIDEFGVMHESENMVVEIERMNNEFKAQNPTFIDAKIILQAVRYYVFYVK